MAKVKRPKDFNECAFTIGEILTGNKEEEYEREKNPHAVALGKLGGKKGGKARAKSLTKKRRVEIAKKAIKTRWAKEKK